MLNGLDTKFPEDRADLICYIEVRCYGDDDDGEYDNYDELAPLYVARNGDDTVRWIKVSSYSNFFKKNEDKCLDEFRFFFINGSLNKGGYDEVEVTPVAYVNERTVYFEPIKQ